MKPYLHSQRGIAIIFALLLVAFMLSIVLALSAIFIPKLHTTAQVKNSIPATYAAESILEWCLYTNRKSAVSRPTMSNDATYTLLGDCTLSPVKATGNYHGVTRAFELTF